MDLKLKILNKIMDRKKLSLLLNNELTTLKNRRNLMPENVSPYYMSVLEQKIQYLKELTKKINNIENPEFANRDLYYTNLLRRYGPKEK